MTRLNWNRPCFQKNYRSLKSLEKKSYNSKRGRIKASESDLKKRKLIRIYLKHIVPKPYLKRWFANLCAEDGFKPIFKKDSVIFKTLN